MSPMPLPYTREFDKGLGHAVFTEAERVWLSKARTPQAYRNLLLAYAIGYSNPDIGFIDSTGNVRLRGGAWVEVFTTRSRLDVETDKGNWYNFDLSDPELFTILPLLPKPSWLYPGAVRPHWDVALGRWSASVCARGDGDCVTAVYAASANHCAKKVITLAMLGDIK